MLDVVWLKVFQVCMYHQMKLLYIQYSIMASCKKMCRMSIAHKTYTSV